MPIGKHTVSSIVPIFVLSLPRAGSTLLQRLIAAHPDVATIPEPWICLPLVFSLKQEVFARYGHKAALWGINGLVERLPDGQKTYYRKLRELILGLYAEAAPAEARFFLDKTPRYHLILPELFCMFPEGKFVFLWRNPLSVIASYVRYFSHGRWMPNLYDDDLKAGLENLLQAAAAYADRSYCISYERIVTDQAEVMGELYGYLGLEGGRTGELGQLDAAGPGDERAKATNRVERDSLDAWRKVICNAGRAAWCGEYLGWIGRERLAAMGYDLDQLRNDLRSVPAHPLQLPGDMLANTYGRIKCRFRREVLKHG